MRTLCTLFVAVTLVATSGCRQAGPGFLRQGRPAYNDAIVDTLNEQLLINLVRLKYRDTPLFLEITGISTQMSVTGSLGFTPTIGAGTAATQYESAVSVGATESPTITYSPLQGKQFSVELLSPISLEGLLRLYSSIWDADLVLKCCVQSLNGVLFAPSSTLPPHDRPPVFRDFLEVTRVMRELQTDNLLHVGLEESGKDYVAVMYVDQAAQDDPRFIQMCKLLKLDPARSYRLASDLVHPVKGTISMHTRSALGLLGLLAQGVEAPQAHMDAGIVPVSGSATEAAFDWRQILDGIIAVHSGAAPPTDAFVSVRYRDYWFWISDTDLSSKTTFSLLHQFFSLQSGATPMNAPVLTLPVSN